MAKNLEINKLEDVVVWFDYWIAETKLDLTEEEMEDDETIKEFETIKKVILESIDRHVDLAKMNRDIIVNQYEVCEDFKKKIAELEEKVKHQKENLDGINKTLEIRAKENERLIAVKNNQQREIEAHESENARLSEKIIELKRTIEKCKDYDNSLIDSLRINNDDLKEQISKLREEQKTLVAICNKYKKENGDYAVRVNKLKKELEDFNDLKTNNAKRRNEIIELKDKIQELEKQNKYLTKELNQTCTTKELDLKGHNRREMALVNELADKNDEIKKLKESIEEWKNQERIRTNQLRATESKVTELRKEIEKFTKGENDHGRAGFKRYIEHLIEEEERAVPERFKARLNEEITAIFTKEEETEVNDIPCGEDAIE